MKSILEKGYALDLEEYEKELNCIAIPFFYKDRIISVIGLSGPAHRFDTKKMVAMAEIAKHMI